MTRLIFSFHQFHFYQPMYTLIGAGVTDAENSERLMTDVLPKYCVLFQSKVEEFDPEASQVQLSTGETVGVFCTYMYIKNQKQINTL